MPARLTLDLSPQMGSEISRLAEDRGTTKADVFRHGLALLFAMDEAKEQGFHVGAWGSRPDGTRVEREFIIPT